MQVEWKTVETLGATRGVDLWYLFPLGVGVTRLLKKDGAISEGWQRRLELLFGTKDWRNQFYQPSHTIDLFGDVEQLERDASVETISAFLKKRLETCYIGVADGKVLYNSKRSPLYLLCFAASNERGGPPALRIAQHILDN